MVLTELLNRRGMRAGGGILYDGPFHPAMLISINAGHYHEPDQDDPRLKDHIGLS
jgi:hypothetical protein